MYNTIQDGMRNKLKQYANKLGFTKLMERDEIEFNENVACGRVTFDAHGKRIERKEVRGDNLPGMFADRIKIRVLSNLPVDPLKSGLSSARRKFTPKNLKNPKKVEQV